MSGPGRDRPKTVTLWEELFETGVIEGSTRGTHGVVGNEAEMDRSGGDSKLPGTFHRTVFAGSVDMA